MSENMSESMIVELVLVSKGWKQQKELTFTVELNGFALAIAHCHKRGPTSVPVMMGRSGRRWAVVGCGGQVVVLILVLGLVLVLVQSRARARDDRRQATDDGRQRRVTGDGQRQRAIGDW